MISREEDAKLTKRVRLLRAFEDKYGEPPARVESIFLMTAKPDEVVARFRDNPGPGIPPQVVGSGFDTANVGDEWEMTMDSFCGDTASLVQLMVPVYAEGFKRTHGRKPTDAELEMVMAVGLSETRFGTAKFPGGLGPGMHNHGAVQAGKYPCDPSRAFESFDTHPLDTGGSQRYPICFRRYASDEAGAADLIRIVGKTPLRMLKEHGNSVVAFSVGMYGNHYYEMFNAPAATVSANRQSFDAIRSLASSPVRGENKWFNDGIARAKQPIAAGRVLMHSIGINKAASAIARSRGRPRATKMVQALPISAKSVAGAAIGAAVGFFLGGPPGAIVGGTLGFVGGTKV